MFPVLYTRFDECTGSNCVTRPGTPDIITVAITNNVTANVLPYHNCRHYDRLLIDVKNPLAPDMLLPNSVYRGRGKRVLLPNVMAKKSGLDERLERLRIARFQERQRKMREAIEDSGPAWLIAANRPRVELPATPPPEEPPVESDIKPGDRVNRVFFISSDSDDSDGGKKKRRRKKKKKRRQSQNNGDDDDGLSVNAAITPETGIGTMKKHRKQIGFGRNGSKNDLLLMEKFKKKFAAKMALRYSGDVGEIDEETRQKRLEEEADALIRYLQKKMRKNKRHHHRRKDGDKPRSSNTARSTSFSLVSGEDDSSSDTSDDYDEGSSYGLSAAYPRTDDSDSESSRNDGDERRLFTRSVQDLARVVLSGVGDRRAISLTPNYTRITERNRKFLGGKRLHFDRRGSDSSTTTGVNDISSLLPSELSPIFKQILKEARRQNVTIFPTIDANGDPILVSSDGTEMALPIGTTASAIAKLRAQLTKSFVDDFNATSNRVGRRLTVMAGKHVLTFGGGLSGENTIDFSKFVLNDNDLPQIASPKKTVTFADTDAKPQNDAVISRGIPQNLVLKGYKTFTMPKPMVERDEFGEMRVVSNVKAPSMTEQLLLHYRNVHDRRDRIARRKDYSTVKLMIETAEEKNAKFLPPLVKNVCI